LDPLFAGAATHDYSLKSSSPCIDAGDPDPVYNDPDGSRNDVGAMPFEGIPVLCGDANSDEQVNVGDAVFIINYVFQGGQAPDPVCAGDANGDGDSNVGDAVYLINYIFNGGPPPNEDCCP
jgi:hypothetical protein